jgi:hypothetical protein
MNGKLEVAGKEDATRSLMDGTLVEELGRATGKLSIADLEYLIYEQMLLKAIGSAVQLRRIQGLLSTFWLRASDPIGRGYFAAYVPPQYDNIM